MFDAERLRRFLAEERAHSRQYARLEHLARSGALCPGTSEFAEHVEPPDPTLTAAVNAVQQRQQTTPGYWRALRSENTAITGASSNEVAAARLPLADMPLIVLTSGRLEPAPGETLAAAEAQQAAWRVLHEEIAALSTRGEQRTVPDAGHGIQLDKPEVVIAAIEDVLAAARCR
jgi:pimeloyl-ACP methyl ester carboxylesterase